jgi:hypothetical protein
MTWPCVVFFETNQLGVTYDIPDPALRRDANLMERLKNVGYRMMHELPEVKAAEEMEGIHDTVAVNCVCQSDELELANTLGNIVTDSFYIQKLCSDL